MIIKEMRKYIDDFSLFNKKLNEGIFGDIVSGVKSSWKRNVIGTYQEPVYIWIFNKNGETIIQNNELSGKVNIKLMDILNDKFKLNLDKDKNGYYTINRFYFDYSKLDEVSDFLTNIGLERKDFGDKNLVFKGKLSMKDLK